MWEATAALPEQLVRALPAAARRSPAPPPAPARRALASPPSGWVPAATACDGRAGAGGAAPAVPFWVGHGAALPAFVDRSTLVLAVSSSGNATRR